jgi:hypothetical protein
MASTYYDYDAYIKPTADDAGKAVQEMMTDLERECGDADRIFCYVVIGGYIIKSAEAQRFIQSQPDLGHKIRAHTDEYLRTKPHLCGILFDVSALLTRLGF